MKIGGGEGFTMKEDMEGRERYGNNKYIYIYIYIYIEREREREEK